MSRPRGRPRDPDLERRVHAAVLDVYWEAGWAGFTLDAVARRARVGRAALYARWTSKDTLLIDALRRHSPMPDPAAFDTGSVRGDLEKLAGRLLTGYTEPGGRVSLRAAMEARVHPELLESLTTSLNEGTLRTARAIVRRGIDRGELPPGTPTTLLLEMLTGAVLSHVLFGPARPARDDGYVAELVGRVLAAFTSS
ncbi:TetR-like C-terminal domain-containing protein [Actinomycetes bacterium KLBMP 9759]